MRDFRQEDIPEINNPNIRFPVLEGDNVIKEEDNGGKHVRLVPPQNSEIIERIKKRYESKRTKIEIIGSRIYHFWRPLPDRYRIISKSSKQARHY